MTIRLFSETLHNPSKFESPKKKSKIESFDDHFDERKIAFLGTKKILEHYYFTQAERDEVPEFGERETVVQGQGNKELRRCVVDQTKLNVHVISPSALREQKKNNLSTYLILFSKRVAHAFSLEGQSTTLNSYFECFNETFTLPMLTATFDICAEFIEPKQHQSIMSVLQNAIWHDNCSDEKIKQSIKEILNPFQPLPLWVGTGYKYHSSQIIFYRTHFIYFNRGEGCGDYPGFRIFKINCTDKIRPEWLKKIADRLSVNSENYSSLKSIIKDLEATEIFYHPMKNQEVGNCTYTGAKAGLLGLLFLSLITKNFTQDFVIDNEADIEATCEQAILLYKPITNIDRQIVAKDFLEGLKSISSKKISTEVQDQEKDVIEQLAKAILNKFQNTPTMILRLSPKLWRDLVVSCEKIYSNEFSIYKPFSIFIDTLLSRHSENKSNIDFYSINQKNLIELAHHFFNQKTVNWYGDDLIWQLYKKNCLAEVLNDANLIDTSLDEIKRYVDISCQNVNPSKKNLILYNLCVELLNNEHLKAAKIILRFISKQSLKNDCLEMLSIDLCLAEENAVHKSCQEAFQTACAISRPWKRFFACHAVILLAEKFKTDSPEDLDLWEKEALDTLSIKKTFSELNVESPKFGVNSRTLTAFVKLLLKHNYINEAGCVIEHVKNEFHQSEARGYFIDYLLKTNNLENVIRAEYRATFINNQKIKIFWFLKIIAAYIKHKKFKFAENILKSIQFKWPLEEENFQYKSFLKLINLCIENDCLCAAETIAQEINCPRSRSSAFRMLHAKYHEDFNFKEAKRVFALITHDLYK